MKFLTRLGWAGWAAFGLMAVPTLADAALLVGNTRGNNVVLFDEISGDFLGDLIPDNGLLDSPDTFVYGPDGNLYISSGTTPENSAILRFTPEGKFIDVFASGNGLFRPYGIAFGPDGNLYVSSFLSDQILRYDGTTGAFIDVFAERQGEVADGLNGPNGLLFGPDGHLYVTTQGSVAVNGAADFSFGLPSIILRYDIATQVGAVFAEQPTPSPDSFGFVSFLGLVTDPISGDLFVSDFANGIRRYDFLTGTLLDELSTNYTSSVPSSSFIGSLAFSPEGDLFTVGFNIASNIGSILKYDAATKERVLLTDSSPQLQRPIGILYATQNATKPVPEPFALWGLVAVAGSLAISRRRI
ncbi:MAG: PEP-CTERM sorting domain-containing protein [Leptolyngbya sp. RL_3_1]|nr:PEP-CTERM sorting domain-containing protein [Leptolyngbya sp. RL_3_1]